MNAADLEKLVRKYYGYVADLEGAGVEALDFLVGRDRIEHILTQSAPAEAIPSALHERVYELDNLLWDQRPLFLAVVGKKELQHARQQQRAPRSHWWWYLDELRPRPERGIEWEERARLAKALAPAG